MISMQPKLKVFYSSLSCHRRTTSYTKLILKINGVHSCLLNQAKATNPSSNHSLCLYSTQPIDPMGMIHRLRYTHYNCECQDTLFSVWQLCIHSLENRLSHGMWAKSHMLSSFTFQSCVQHVDIVLLKVGFAHLAIVGIVDPIYKNLLTWTICRWGFLIFGGGTIEG
jgi:hypothetical protein